MLYIDYVMVNLLYLEMLGTIIFWLIEYCSESIQKYF